MNKKQEIELWQKFAESLPVSGTYSGQWVREQIGALESAIRGDVFPDAFCLSISEAHATAGVIREQAEKEAAAIVERAKREADAMVKDYHEMRAGNVSRIVSAMRESIVEMERWAQ